MDDQAPRKPPSLHLPVAEPRRRPCKGRCSKVSLIGPLHKRYPDKVHPQFLLHVGKFIESRPVQIVFTILFILDIAIVLAELILETELTKQELELCKLNCTVEDHAQQQRRTVDFSVFFHLHSGRQEPPGNQTEGGGGEAAGDSVECENSKGLLSRLETAETCLHWISIGILSFFALELLTLIVVFNIYFFLHIFYMLDLVVVGATLGLEIGLRSAVSYEVTGVIIFLRLWRLVRAGHGVLTLEGEAMSELKLKIRRNARKYAKLQSDAHEYELELLSLEALLEANGICHPEFSNLPEKFHKTSDNHFEIPEDSLEPGEREMINKWLADAAAANKNRVLRLTKESELRESQLKANKGGGLRATQEKAMPEDPQPIREPKPRAVEEREVDLDPFVAGSTNQQEQHRHHQQQQQQDEHSDSYEEFLSWKKTH